VAPLFFVQCGVIYGLDCLYPPTREVAEDWRQYGWQWLAVYIGGPRAAAGRSWQEIEGLHTPVRDLGDTFLGFLPIYVGANFPWDPPQQFNYERGLQDGKDADDCLARCAFASPSVVCLDVEYGCWQNYGDRVVDYVRGWVEAVNDAGHRAGVYSDIDTLNRLPLGELVDFKWGAAWIKGGFSEMPPEGHFDPESPPPWDIWQYAGGELENVSVDVNSARDGFEFAPGPR
jgi:hypothetical protein